MSTKENGQPTTESGRENLIEGRGPVSPVSTTSSTILLDTVQVQVREEDEVRGIEEILVESEQAGVEAERILDTSQASTPTEPMYLPGRIIHIEEKEDATCTILRKHKESFTSICVTPRMIADHLPNAINHVFDKV